MYFVVSSYNGGYISLNPRLYNPYGMGEPRQKLNMIQIIVGIDDMHNKLGLYSLCKNLDPKVLSKP